MYTNCICFGCFSDFDECKLDNTCSQKCHNTNGSYVCSCVDGYMLKADSRGCKALGTHASSFCHCPTSRVLC